MSRPNLRPNLTTLGLAAVVLLGAGGLLPLLTASAAPTCPTWTDPAGDETVSGVADPSGASSDNDLDIVATTVAVTSDGGLVTRVQVVKLGASGPSKSAGDTFVVTFKAAGVSFSTTVNRDAVDAPIATLSKDTTTVATGAAKYDTAANAVYATFTAPQVKAAFGAALLGKKLDTFSSSASVNTPVIPTTPFSPAVGFPFPTMDDSAAPASLTYTDGGGCDAAADASGAPSTTPTPVPTGSGAPSPTPSPSSSPSPSPAATQLTVTRGPAIVTYDVATTVVGHLTRSDSSAAVAGQQVALQVRPKGSGKAFSTVATSTTTSSGYATISTYKPTYALEYRLVARASNSYQGAASATRSAVIQRDITAKWSSSSVSVGRGTVLSGTVYPSSRGKVLTLQRRSGGKWVTVGSLTLGSTSRYAFTVKPASKGTWYYRLLITSDKVFTTSTANAPALRAT